MLANLDQCWTYALNSKIWKKMKNKKGGLDWTPLTIFILGLLGLREPPNLLNLASLKGRLRWAGRSHNGCHHKFTDIH